jgi:hypothetical protein
MAYGRKHAGGGGRAKLTGTKIANHRGGHGFKLHSDMKESAAKGHSKAPKMARKAV